MAEAEVGPVIVGQFTAAPGAGQKIVTLPPGRRGLWAVLQPASSADAGLIVFGNQFNGDQSWTAVPTYTMTWDSAAVGDVAVNFYLLTTDDWLQPISYGGA